ncbi:hypothetical protein C7412_115173 [Paraburkholderia silvatlantica]|nr:hypothetical protein C7412_115173 [Paraburkholderia silvatlantica]
MLATLENLGVVASFSRPRVSNDTPFAESPFRTRKYRPDYPRRPFGSIDEARAWKRWRFDVDWRNRVRRPILVESGAESLPHFMDH